MPLMFGGGGNDQPKDFPTEQKTAPPPPPPSPPKPAPIISNQPNSPIYNDLLPGSNHDLNELLPESESHKYEADMEPEFDPEPAEPEPPAAASKAKEAPKKARAKERENIFAAALDMTEDYKIPNYYKSNAAIKFIESVLCKFFVFQTLNDEERRTLILAMQMDMVYAGEYIITQGETGDYFYVVDDGIVDFAVNDKKVGSCGRGGSFGELALLYDCPRSASCIANTKCRLWKIDQKTFRYMLAATTQQKGIHDVLRKIPFLEDLDSQQLSRIIDALTTVTFDNGHRIIQKGDIGEHFYIIKEGTALVHDIGSANSNYKDQPIGPGDFFGERALLTGEPRGASITATSLCHCLCLARKTFDEVLGPLQGLIERAMKKRTLLGVQLISKSNFQPFELKALSDLMVETTFAKGTVLAEKGKPLRQNLIIIRTGRVLVETADGNIIMLKDADYFNDKYIKEPDGFISQETIICESDEVSCGVLSKKDIESVIGNVKRLGQPLEKSNLNKLDKSMKLKDLKKIRILGVGTFGKVWLVTHKKKGNAYALKQLSKREIIGHKQVDGVIREKNIMATLDHPFVVNLVAAFQDDRSLYMMIELVQGGELFSVIHTDTHDGIPNGNARFYAACILESLSHLHHRGVCYRDLKPENLLIDKHGFCVLVDLGFAKVVHDKTYTLCGTPEYLSPEIILSKGHDKGADYWALGVLIYEMLAGASPFFSPDASQSELFNRIIKCDYYFPDDDQGRPVMQEAAEDLIQRLLVIRQSQRLGCMARADKDIRDHKWFEVINVDKLLKKQWPTPWKPQLTDPLDSAHFDDYSHLEKEDPSEHSKLSKKEQKMFEEF